MCLRVSGICGVSREGLLYPTDFPKGFFLILKVNLSFFKKTLLYTYVEWVKSEVKKGGKKCTVTTTHYVFHSQKKLALAGWRRNKLNSDTLDYAADNNDVFREEEEDQDLDWVEAAAAGIPAKAVHPLLGKVGTSPKTPKTTRRKSRSKSVSLAVPDGLEDEEEKSTSVSPSPLRKLSSTSSQNQNQKNSSNTSVRNKKAKQRNAKQSKKTSPVRIYLHAYCINQSTSLNKSGLA